MEMVFRGRRNLLKIVVDALSFTEDYILIMPGDIVDRTRLLCMYVEEETGVSFSESEVVYLLYADFLNYYVKNPCQNRILKEVGRKVNSYKEKKKSDKDEDEYIKIVCDGVEYLEKPIDVDRNKEKSNDNINKNKTVCIKMDKREAQKGKIVLDEIYITMGVRISMQELLASLWINFIEDYRNGKNKRAYKSIIKVLKNANLK